jgi:hypothetical protein
MFYMRYIKQELDNGSSQVVNTSQQDFKQVLFEYWLKDIYIKYIFVQIPYIYLYINVQYTLFFFDYNA